MDYHFYKLQGAGNDFVVLDALSHPLSADLDLTQTAIQLCDRHFGVGADGLLTLEAATPEASIQGAALRMRMWNPDGTEDMCGNGLRCVAALAWHQQHVIHPNFLVQTLAGLRQIEIIRPDWIRAGMGHPHFEPTEIPVLLPPGSQSSIEWPIEVANRQLTVTSLSTGSTHSVIFLENPLSEEEFQTLSPLLENHIAFPQRTSIMWALPDGPNRFTIRIWERGVGETLACGTGASAVAVAAQVTKRANGSIEVQSRGGTLKVDWLPNEEIFLTGPAELVFEATFHDKNGMNTEN